MKRALDVVNSVCLSTNCKMGLRIWKKYQFWSKMEIDEIGLTQDMVCERIIIESFPQNIRFAGQPVFRLLRSAHSSELKWFKNVHLRLLYFISSRWTEGTGRYRENGFYFLFVRWGGYLYPLERTSIANLSAVCFLRSTGWGIPVVSPGYFFLHRKCIELKDGADV